ncbi:MAG: hypothetical protein ACOCSE_01295 [Chitinivibrionales bacterium]
MSDDNNKENSDRNIREIYENTSILRKPISGIIPEYHQIEYILLAPDDKGCDRSLKVNGKINVSPKLLISPETVQEKFGDVFDPETFEQGIVGRVFSFAMGKRKQYRIKNEYFNVQELDEDDKTSADRILDQLMAKEDISTALIHSPSFDYYPVSIDKFINEILNREFNV